MASPLQNRTLAVSHFPHLSAVSLYALEDYVDFSA